MYFVRSAKASDLTAILNIYANARKFMASRGNPTQWGKTNPPREQLEEDIALQRLYVICREQVIHGVFYFWIGEDPTYGYIEGSWRNNADYGTIHRIASCGRGGVFEACLTYCLGITRHLRIDTHRDNKVMQHVVEEHGFTRRGIIYIADGTPRVAYDLIKKS